MKIPIHFLNVIIITLLFSCNTSRSPVFGKRTPHEKYSDGITNAGLKQTEIGKLWFTAASKGLQQPQRVTLPYKETGYFAAERPSAAGYLFAVKRGENVLINISTVPASGILFFVELWQATSDKPLLLTVMDTSARELKYAVKKDGDYLFRLQPELLRSVEYTVTVTTGPSLAFPVDRSGNPKIISLWGTGRDGGTRSHEGVDIAAKFHTPVLAAANGIARVSENKLGGKAIFLTDENTGYSLYYAHLDSQIAHTGQRVATGEVIGLVGKTGNAQHTVPHLHFGIYTDNGAIDPLVFIDSTRREPKPITISTAQLNKWLRITEASILYEEASTKSAIKRKTGKGDAVLTIAASGNFYKIELPDGQTGYINSNVLTDKVLRQQKIKDETRLLDAPDLKAPAKAIIPPGTS